MFGKLMAVVLMVTTCWSAQAAEIVGVVTPMPERHFQGSPAKEWPVTKIHVQVGSKVKAGDCLVELDPAMFPQQKAKAEWESAQAHLEVLKARLALRESMKSRCARLVPGGASQQELDICTEAVEVLKRELNKGVADERAVYSAYRMAKYDFDTYQRINSLINGEVVAVRCTLGIVARAEAKQLVWVEVIDSSRVHIRCSLLPHDVVALLSAQPQKTVEIVGTKCTAKLIAAPKIVVNGKVEVFFEAENLDSELTCGQEVRLSF